MVSVTFSAFGFDAIKRFGPLLAAAELATKAHMNAHAKEVIRRIKEYPPPPSNSTYTRTFLLYNSWRVLPAAYSGGDLEVGITNDAPYWRFVQGDWQQWYHRRTGWRLVYDYTDRAAYRRGLLAIYKDYTRRLMDP